MRAIACLTFMVAAVFATPASARSWPDAGGWDIVESDDSCYVSSEFEGKGDTQLTLVIYPDGQALAFMTNTGWTAKTGEEYVMSWVLNGSSYTGPNIGSGKEYDSRKGFGAKFGADFVGDFGKAADLRVYRGSVLVDQLSLVGSGAAVAMGRRCAAHVQASIAAVEREKKRLAHIADDPFAGPSASGRDRLAANAAPRGSPGSWVTDADYPSQAQREGRAGVTGFRLNIGAEGRVTDCTVTSTSGSPDLDAATCRLLPRRARFTPGTDAAGVPIAGTYDGKIPWRLPE